MKTLKTLAASTILVTGSASAVMLEGVSTASDIQVHVENGVATLSGRADNGFDSIQAELAAERIDGVEAVRNLLTVDLVDDQNGWIQK